MIVNFYLNYNWIACTIDSRNEVFYNMSGRTGGQRPRPRVALLGTFGVDNVDHFIRMFPTPWRADNMQRLKEMVDVREIDLIVINSKPQPLS